MLRLIVLFLLISNGLYFGWSQGYLSDLGFAPVQPNEPHRVQQQIAPKALRLLSPQEVKAATEAAESARKAAIKPTECLQAGLFNQAQSTLLRQALESSSWPVGSWILEATTEPGRWIVYMGQYPSADALLKKRQQLAALKLRFEPLRNRALEFGLSLGGYSTEAAANTALEALSQRGVRTARVVQESAEIQGTMLRLPTVDDALRNKLDDLKPLLNSKALSLCH